MIKTSSVLRFADVSVRFRHDTVSALDSVSFQVGPGERVALLGLNGSGKSTLLASAVGLVPFDGTISVLQKELNERTVRHIRRDVGFLFSIPEDQILFPKVIDDVAFSLLQRGASIAQARQNAAEVLSGLDALELSEMAPDELSHGQRLRVALAGAIVSHPPLLLLDEPSAGLDPRGTNSLIRYLRLLSSAMLVATHDLTFARRLCDRFILLEKGKIKMEGTDYRQVEGYWDLDVFDVGENTVASTGS